MREEETLDATTAPDAAWLEVIPDEELLATLRASHGAGLYPLGERLGIGGMGVVRSARQVLLSRGVAVKTLRPDRRDAIHAARLLREAWVLGSLEHPNIVPVYDLRLDPEGYPLLVQKRIEGVAWSELLANPAAHAEARRGEDPLVWDLRVLLEVCKALRFAHRRGIVHRDVKPQNVMIGSVGEVYLVDWGVAVSLRDDESGLLPTAHEQHAIVGTPVYMPPELVGDSNLVVSERTDVYLLGATLYELVCGQPPHRRPSSEETLTAILASEPRIGADVPDELAALIREAMARAPERRIESVDVFQERVESFLRHRASVQLARDAKARFSELPALLAAGDRTLIYKQYGAIRFGCLESSKNHPEGALARETLVGAVRAMVSFEIAQGEPNAASRLLAELDEPPTDLTAEVEAALSEQRHQRASLERLRADHDLTIAARARNRFGVIVGTVWIAVPLVGLVTTQILGRPQNKLEAIAIPVAALALASVVGVSMRADLVRTGPNRLIFGAVFFAFAAQLSLNVGLLSLGHGPPEAQLLVHVPLALIAAFFALAVHRRFLVSVLIYVLGYAAVLMHPELRFVSIALGNLVLFVTVLRLPERR